MKYVKKTYLLVMMLCSYLGTINAQDNTNDNSSEKCFNENTHVMNFGVGFGNNNYYTAYRGNGYHYKSSPAFSFSYEQAFRKKLGPGFLGLGAYLGYQGASSTYNYHWDKNGYDNNYYYKNSWNNFMVAARGAYHFDFLNSKRAEVYFGALAGLRIQSYQYETNNPDPYAVNYSVNSGRVFPTFSVFAGARWYFVKNVALFAEAGYGISYLTGGLSIKF
jgi:hypothetical protein